VKLADEAADALLRERDEAVALAKRATDDAEFSTAEDVRRRAFLWLTNGEKGLSSETMCLYLLSGEVTRRFPGPMSPSDPSDLGRCLGLLDFVPEWRARLPEMAAVSAEWAALVPIWDRIEALYREERPTGSAPRCYAAMREALDAAPPGEET
jgi:hypothetical protein